MKTDDLANVPLNEALECDVVIIGSGPVGVTIARELYRSGLKIFVLESGLRDERADYNELLTVESIGEPQGEVVVSRRQAFHGAGAKLWTHEQQGYGLRCRVLGGSSHAWAGKSALFDPIDFDKRAWVENSGWPISRSELSDAFARAAKHLNLGPNCYDKALFDLLGIAPTVNTERTDFHSFFWQFARSRVDKMDIMRFGPEFAAEYADNVRLFLNATVTHINTDPSTGAFTGVEVATLNNERRLISAESAVLAAGGIENARLLLASNRIHPAGLGNAHDVVGRYLMDHLGVRIGRFGKTAVKPIQKAFGFFGLAAGQDVYMYQHGLALDEAVQAEAGLLNSSVYILEDRAVDDPWEAIKRLLRRRSEAPMSDVLVAIKSLPLIVKGVGIKALQHRLMPSAVRAAVINLVLTFNPNMAVSEFQDRGVPHKLTGLIIDAVVEQPPRWRSRVELSSRHDAVGMPLAKISWAIGDQERETLVELADRLKAAFAKMGLPEPELDPWAEARDASLAPIIDMGHTCGTTRMSDDPRSGVVDRNCQVHGVQGLFVCGSSVFPTSGHANTTLMAVALAVRLADHLTALNTRSIAKSKVVPQGATAVRA